MPRASLPSSLKQLYTYPVLLTKTTEEELLKYFEEESQTFEERWKPFQTILTDAINELHRDNPYRRHNWRRGIPKRMFPQGHIPTQSEEELERYEKITFLGFDLKRCDTAFHWSDTHEWVRDFLYKLESLRQQQNDNRTELMELDQLCFYKAQKEWEAKDADWIVNENKRKEHMGHHPREYWEELFRTDKDAERYHKGIIPDNDETCELCIKFRKEREEQAKIEAEKEERRRKQEEEEREEERLAQERRERERKEREARAEQEWLERPVKKCDACNFQTRSETTWLYHCASADHVYNEKKKALYCPVCDIQCSHRLQYDAHITSNKHKKKAAGETECNLHCDLCNYTATTKGNLDIHCKSKKHQRNMETQGRVQEAE